MTIYITTISDTRGCIQTCEKRLQSNIGSEGGVRLYVQRFRLMTVKREHNHCSSRSTKEALQPVFTQTVCLSVLQIVSDYAIGREIEWTTPMSQSVTKLLCRFSVGTSLGHKITMVGQLYIIFSLKHQLMNNTIQFVHFCISFSLALNIHEETRVPWSWFNRSSLAWLVVTFTPQLRYLYKVTHHFSVSPNNCSCCGMNSSETKLITLSCFFIVKL